MNEQVINKLAKRASSFSCTDKNEGRVYEAFVEKFAELIIKESINVVNKRYMGDNNREDFEVRRCVEALKKHFGVEE